MTWRVKCSCRTVDCVSWDLAIQWAELLVHDNKRARVFHVPDRDATGWAESPYQFGGNWKIAPGLAWTPWEIWRGY